MIGYTFMIPIILAFISIVHWLYISLWINIFPSLLRSIINVIESDIIYAFLCFYILYRIEIISNYSKLSHGYLELKIKQENRGI